MDDDGDGVIDSPSTCWRAVFAFDGRDGGRCLGSAASEPPAACSGYRAAGQRPLFWLAARPVPGTVGLVQCSLGRDHAVVRAPAAPNSDFVGPPATESVEAWEALGYDCSVTLGYAWGDAAPFASARPPMGSPCLLTRHVAADPDGGPLGTHAVGLGDEPPGLPGTLCEPAQRYVVMADAPACLSGDAPESCVAPMCPPRTAGERVVAADGRDPIVAPGEPFTAGLTARNTGETTWRSGWVWTSLDRETAPLPLTHDVEPGRIVTLPVTLVPPAQGVDLHDDWALRASATGPPLVSLRLSYDVATEDIAELGLVTFGGAAGFAPGVIGAVEVVVRNRGDNHGWGSDWALVREVGRVTRVARVPLPGVLNPNHERVFTIPAVAPLTPGIYVERWHLERPDGSVAPVDWKASFSFEVSVVGAEVATLIDETAPDGLSLPPGASFVKAWRIRNDSDEPWPAGWRLQHVTGGLTTTEALIPDVTLAPGEDYLLAVPLSLPREATAGFWSDGWELRTVDDTLITVRSAHLTGFGPLTERPGRGWLRATVRPFPGCAVR